MPLLDALLGFDIRDPRTTELWALNHSADHEEIEQAIQAQGGGNLTRWQLYPVNFKDWESFALRHQSAHNSENEALGLEGSDLMIVDFNDPRSAQEWHQSHFAEHQAARERLKI